MRNFTRACGKQIKAAPHNSAARLATSFPPSAACKFLDLPPVNLRNLHLHLTKNPFAGRPPHLCGVALRGRRKRPFEAWKAFRRADLFCAGLWVRFGAGRSPLHVASDFPEGKNPLPGGGAEGGVPPSASPSVPCAGVRFPSGCRWRCVRRR